MRLQRGIHVFHHLTSLMFIVKDGGYQGWQQTRTTGRAVYVKHVKQASEEMNDKEALPCAKIKKAATKAKCTKPQPHLLLQLETGATECWEIDMACEKLEEAEEKGHACLQSLIASSTPTCWRYRKRFWGNEGSSYGNFCCWSLSVRLPAGFREEPKRSQKEIKCTDCNKTLLLVQKTLKESQG